MNNKYYLIIPALLVSLFIYLFYRTDRTVVNELLIRLISFSAYAELKANITRLLPLSKIVIYSLPEGLWVFCITLTSIPYYIGVNKWRIDCVFAPLIFSIGLEILQLFHITNGRFDFMDIAASLAFWLLGRYVYKGVDIKENIFYGLNTKTVVCIATYGIVYLAHVIK